MDITKSLSATISPVEIVNKEVLEVLEIVDVSIPQVKPTRKYVRKIKINSENEVEHTEHRKSKIPRKPRQPKVPKVPKEPKVPKVRKEKVEKTEKTEKIKKVKNVKNVKLPELLCIGRRNDNQQCSRLKCKNEMLCKYHLKRLPNGTINDTIIKSKPVKHSRTRRGRKRKADYDPRINNKDYVILWEHVVDDNKYLTDKYGNIYTMDLEHPKFIGIQTLDNKLKLVS